MLQALKSSEQFEVSFTELNIQIGAPVSLEQKEGKWYLNGKRMQFATDTVLSMLIFRVDPEGYNWDEIGSIVVNPTALACLFAEDVVKVDDVVKAFNAEGNGGEGMFLTVTYFGHQFFVEVRPDEYLRRFDINDPGKPAVILLDRDGYTIAK